jgi:hypothetical protein
MNCVIFFEQDPKGSEIVHSSALGQLREKKVNQLITSTIISKHSNSDAGIGGDGRQHRRPG